MATPRASLITTLENTFKTDSNIKKQAIDSGLKRLGAKRTDRVFDNFPQLLPNDQFKTMQQSFRQIIKEIKDVNKTKNGYQLTKESDTQLIYAWQQILAKTGRDELFSKDKQIKSELVELCGWKKYVNEMKPLDLLNAYVCATSQRIVNRDFDFIMENADAYHAFMQHANDNYSEWNKNLLKADGFDVDSNLSFARKMLEFPKKHPVATIGIFAAAVVVGAAAISTLFAKSDEAIVEAATTNQPPM